MRNEDKEQLSYILKTSISKSNHKNELDALNEQYEHYKKNFVKDITFDTTKIGLSMLICLWIIFLFSFTMIGSEGVLYVSFFPQDSSVESRLQVVHIYFDTSTFDQIERDVKVRFFNKT